MLENNEGRFTSVGNRTTEVRNARSLGWLKHGAWFPISSRPGLCRAGEPELQGRCSLPCIVDCAWTAVHALPPAWIEAARDSTQKQRPRGLQNTLFPLQGRGGAPVMDSAGERRARSARSAPQRDSAGRGGFCFTPWLNRP